MHDHHKLLAGLRSIVGDEVVTDPDVIRSYATDWTGRFVGHSAAVVRPGSTEEVAAIIAICRELGASLVPQGGNTGLVGGGVPLSGEVVLSLRRLDSIETVDPLAGQVTAGAGAPLSAVHQAAETAGWSYAVDLASRDSATVGGTIGTNAGGAHVVRYGGTRAQLVGVEAVLGTGAVVSHLGGLIKDNTGYHLPSLLCGSEGTLGVVTAARLRLVPSTPCRTVALLAFSAVEDALAATTSLRLALSSLSAAELFLDAGLDLVCSTTGMSSPFPRPYRAYLLIEAADRTDPTDALADSVSSIDHVNDVVVATEPSRRVELWRYREAHTEAINTLGAPHKLDVTLPPATLPAFVEEVPALVETVEPNARTWLFGHVGDGNIHVNVSGLLPDDERVEEKVFGLVAELHGSISAEHGIGTAKKKWLHLSRTAEEITAFRSLKGALDPDSVLNPAALLP
jgi:FAD/FMN-containing dehydrogenase